MTDGAAATVIVGQLETVAPGPDGTYVPVVKVTFRTPSGAIGSVEIPKTHFSVEVVREVVKAHAAALESVASLQIT